MKAEPVTILLHRIKKGSRHLSAIWHYLEAIKHSGLNEVLTEGGKSV